MIKLIENTVRGSASLNVIYLYIYLLIRLWTTVMNFSHHARLRARLYCVSVREIKYLDDPIEGPRTLAYR